MDVKQGCFIIFMAVFFGRGLFLVWEKSRLQHQHMSVYPSLPVPLFFLPISWRFSPPPPFPPTPVLHFRNFFFESLVVAFWLLTPSSPFPRRPTVSLIWRFFFFPGFFRGWGWKIPLRQGRGREARGGGRKLTLWIPCIPALLQSASLGI